MIWGDATLMTDFAKLALHCASASGPEWQIIKKGFGQTQVANNETWIISHSADAVL